MKINIKKTLSLKSNPLIIFIGINVIFFTFVFGLFTYAQWAEPTSAPPNNNAFTPLNISGTWQFKQGGFTVGNSSAASVALHARYGRVGIGNGFNPLAAPVEALDRFIVQDGGNIVLRDDDAGDAGDIVFRNSAGTQLGRIWSSSAQGLSLSSGDTSPDIYINSVGNVGIRTASITDRLTVNGGITTIGGTLQINRPSTTGGWARGIHIHTTDGATRYGGVGMYGSDTTINSIYIAHGASPWSSTAGIHVLPSGNVGVGLTGPTQRLHVNGNTQTTNLYATNGISTYDTTVPVGTVETSQLCLGNGVNCITNWTDTTGAGGTLPSAATANQTLRSNGTSWVASSILTNNDTTVQINSGADVTPTGGGAFVVGDTAGLHMNVDSNEISAFNGATLSDFHIMNDGGNVRIHQATPGGFYVNGSHLAVTSGGNVGIGTISPGSRLQIGGSSGDAHSGDEITIVDDAPQIKFRDTSGTTSYWMHNNGGRLYFLPDRDNNNAWEGPYPLVLHDGNVGISGVSTPAYALDVGGDIRVGGNNINFGTGARITSGGAGDLRFMGNRGNDGSYEWVGWYSGASRAGIFLWDGSWSGCSATRFCVVGDTHQLMLASNTGNVLINDSVDITGGLNMNNNGIASIASFTTSNPGGGSIQATWEGNYWRYRLGGTSDPAGLRIDRYDTPVIYLQRDGDVHARAFYYTSDIELKKDIEPISSALDKILKLNGYSYNWKENNERDLGVIAQEVEKVFPELVSTPEEGGYKNVDYGHLVAPLIEAIKEQQAQIEDLEQRLEVLEAKIK